MGEQRIKGPEFPLIDKIKNFYRKVIFVKLDKKGIDLVKTKEYLKKAADSTLSLPEFKQAIIEFDVDPL